ncbi:MAG: DUF393 domain-containing protein [Chloroflexi bacterium]|nr:DUF393 domain-containing protein [Chloroflexota bacterium]
MFYDSDCGFCTRSARLLRRLDGARHLRLIPLHRAAETTPDAPPEQRLLETMHCRDRSGRWFAGGAACLQISHIVPALRPVGGWRSFPSSDRSSNPPTHSSPITGT